MYILAQTILINGIFPNLLLLNLTILFCFQGRDLTIAFLLVTVTYTLVGAVFYICFPLAKSCIEDVSI